MKKSNILTLALITSIVINIVFVVCAVYHVITGATLPPIAMGSMISLITTPMACILGIIITE